MIKISVIQFLRSFINFIVLTLIFFSYEAQDLSNFFIYFAQIQIGWSFFGFFSNQYYMKKYLGIQNLNTEILNNQIRINLISYLFVTISWLIIDQSFIIFSFLFSYMIIAKPLEDYYKTRQSSKEYIFSNFVSLCISSIFRLSMLFFGVDLFYFILFMFIEEFIRLIHYLIISPRLNVKIFPTSIKRQIKYIVILLRKVIPLGCTYFAVTVATRSLFVSSAEIFDDHKLSMLGFTHRIVEASTGILVQLSIILFVKDNIRRSQLNKLMRLQWLRIIFGSIFLLTIFFIVYLVNIFFNFVHISLIIFALGMLFIALSSMLRNAWYVELSEEKYLLRNFCVSLLIIVLIKSNFIYFTDLSGYVLLCLIINIVNSPYADILVNYESSYSRAFKKGLTKIWSN